MEQFILVAFFQNMDIDPNAGVFNLSAPLRSSLWCARFSQEDFSVLPSIRSRDKIYVYPNPAQDYIFIDERFRNWQFRVVSASGSIALSGTISDFIIPLDIPSGLYSLQIQNSFGVWENLKFLIQK